MWPIFFLLSVCCFILSVALCIVIGNRKRIKKRKFNFFNLLLAGTFAAAFCLFVPVNIGTADVTVVNCFIAILLSVINSVEVFGFGCDYGAVVEIVTDSPQWLIAAFQLWVALVFVIAPIFTAGVVLSLFKNIFAHIRYLCAYFKDAYVFSELNEKSLVLAGDIKKNNPKAVVIFTDVFKDSEEKERELIEQAKEFGAINFRKDILVIDFNRHSAKKSISFFAIGEDEQENLNQSLKLIKQYKNREKTRIYVFSIRIESELLLTSVDKGKVKVHRVNEVKSLINRTLYTQGQILFDGAKKAEDGSKHISAVVVGMGNHGTQMVKALSWFCQMDGYKLKINAFDKDPLAEEKFVAVVPELMSAKYNGVDIEGEAQYKITVHADTDVQTITFANKIKEISDATYVFVALGNDDVNINTAVMLRMYFERMKIHPVIHAVVYNSQQKKALEGIKNFKGQVYDIAFIGDMESSYTEDVIIDSELEEDALERHMKWGEEDTFWTYEYNYHSSVASAIHMKAREKCGIPGATKKEEELTPKERNVIEALEHRRWNAYMRSEGYVFSGSTDPESRNDLAKTHNDLVDYETLADDEKRKDGSVGTK